MEKKTTPGRPGSSGSSFFREVQIEFLIHELKDPVAIIETGARSLLEKKEKYGSLTPRQEKTLKRVLRSTKKAQEMLRDLLEIGRSEAGSILCCRFQAARVVYDVLLQALETKAADIFEGTREFSQEFEVLDFLCAQGIVLDVDPQLIFTEIFQDEIKFRQILANLIKNALHYRKKRLTIRVGKDSDTLRIEISDDGPGIAPEHHQFIFRRYTQLNACSALSRQSHGLGLAGALILARCLGGDIELTSSRGDGATFCLIIPLAMKNGGGKDAVDQAEG